MGYPCSAFRAGIIKMDPEIDRVKPLAPIDEAGWVYSSGMMIGAVDKKWVGAYSLKRRKFEWWYKLEEPLVAPITTLGSWVVLGERNGKVVKVETLSGKKTWEVNLGRYVSRPFVLAGSVLLCVTIDQKMFAVDFQSGRTLWVYDAGATSALIVSGAASPNVSENVVYLGTPEGSIHAVSLSSGTKIWEYNPKFSDFRFHEIVGETVVANKKLLLSRYDGIVASIRISENLREIDWEKKLPSITTSAFHAGIYYVGGLNGNVYALDSATGKELWNTPTFETVKSITVGEKVAYIGGAEGRITAINLFDGKPIWFDDIDGTINKRPIVFDNYVLFGTGLKVFYAYKIK